MATTFDTEELKTRSTALTNGSIELEAIFTTLKAQVDELKLGWTNAGSQEFTNLYESFNSSAQTVQASLASIGTSLAKAAGTLEDTEAAIKAAFTA